MTSKQRANLKSIAMNIEPVVRIGKESLTPEVVKSTIEALDAREIIKVAVLQNCFDDVREIAEVLAERSHSEVVQTIGRKIVLYKPNEDKSKRKIDPNKKRQA